MRSKLIKILPWVALVSFLVGIGCLVYLSIQRGEITTDTGETRRAVEKTINELLDNPPESLEDEEFLARVEAAEEEPYIVSISFFGSSLHFTSDSTYSYELTNCFPVINHQDVFAYMVRFINASNGSWAGMLSVTYDKNPKVSEPGLAWKVAVIVGFAGVAVYWVSLPGWVFLDARQRGERAWVWAIFVMLGNVVALLGYLLVRSPEENLTVAG